MSALHQLARSNGVQLSYRDAWGRTRRASDEALAGVLRALGVCGERAASRREQPIEPVLVAWDGAPMPVPRTDGAALECTLVSEDGDEVAWRVDDGADIEIPPLPLGYHDLLIAGGGHEWRSRIIAAPRRVSPSDERSWGTFLPLYALRTQRSPAVADLGDLEALASWTASMGGSFTGTLPLFSAFLDEPFDPSPYAPVSRLFWNELYVDATRTPEFARCRAAREIPAPETGDLIDYREAYAWKRRILALLAEEFFSTGARRADLERFVVSNPLAEDYAHFRAQVEGDYELHLYSQLIADEQLNDFDGKLYLDLPVGVHPLGYDAATFDVFASGVSAGAPPDDFFEGGQKWGFPPLDPIRSRTDGHGYFVRCIRTLAARSGMVRIDHVMGLHRLFWIPDGMDASDGVYVRYPSEELYAVLTLEASRHGCTIVGEDLGTVPNAVRASMRRHGLLRSHVFQFEPDATPPAGSVASLNTHDTPTFAQWGGASLHESLRSLAASAAGVMIVNLEDVWGEDRPQNVPGTTWEKHPNWRRKAARTFEEFRDDETIVELLTEIDQLRRTA